MLDINASVHGAIIIPLIKKEKERIIFEGRQMKKTCLNRFLDLSF